MIVFEGLTSQTLGDTEDWHGSTQSEITKEVINGEPSTIPKCNNNNEGHCLPREDRIVKEMIPRCGGDMKTLVETRRDMDVQDNCCGQGVMHGNNLKETAAMFAPKTCYDGLMQSKIWRTGERSHGDAHRPVAFLHLWVPLQLERDVEWSEKLVRQQCWWKPSVAKTDDGGVEGV